MHHSGCHALDLIPCLVLQHSKDRMFMTATEWKEVGGGRKQTSLGRAYQPLAFDSCALSLQPYEVRHNTSSHHFLSP